MSIEPLGTTDASSATGTGSTSKWTTGPRPVESHRHAVSSAYGEAATTDAAAEAVSDLQVGRAMLSLSHLRPDEAEVATMTSRLDALRADVRALYLVPEARYEQPGVVFRAMP